MVSYIGNGNLSQIILIPIVVIATSLYFFPFEFSFAIGINTKLAMAVFGGILLCFQLAKKGCVNIEKNLLKVFFWAFIVSLCGFVSVLYNSTTDFTYATYIMSMFVWLSAANVVVSLIRSIHGYVSVLLVCRYLVAVCCLQCVSALLIDNFESFRIFVNTYLANFSSSVSTGLSLHDAGRLYGIGAALDIAGSRFSVVLVMIAYCISLHRIKRIQLLIFVLSFFFIFIIGSSISRTTLIGMILAIFCWIVLSFKSVRRRLDINDYDDLYIKYLFSILVLLIPVVVYLYNVSASFQDSFRFAFEGFFNWVETGSWRTNSTDTLKEMYLFPENIKTWVIGDGYFADPTKTDPYYIGISLSAFYKGVDVGYLRFIYYFGIIGLVVFILYFVKVTKSCFYRFPSYKLMFFLVLVVNLIVWFKVATDVFLVFAPFLCICQEDEKAYWVSRNTKCT